MSTKHPVKVCIQRIVVPFIAVFAVLIAVASPGQEVDTSQPSTKPPTMSLVQPTRPSQGLFAPLSVAARSQSKTAAASAATANPIFLPPVLYDSRGSLAWSIAVGDLNGDGKPDLAVVNYAAVGYGVGGSIGVLLGNGDGTFQPAVAYGSGGGGPSGIAVGDLNGDGNLDLIVANQGCQGVSTNCLGVLLGNGDGTFQAVMIYADGGAGWAGGEGIFIPIMIADLNGDGKPDLVVVSQTNSNFVNALVGVLLGNGDGTFKPVVTYDAGGFAAFSGVLADVNGDGKPDLVVLNCGPSGLQACPSSQATVGVLLGNGDGTFQPAKNYSTGGWGSFFSRVLVADVNRDGKPDILVGNACPNNCSPLGDGSFAVMLGYGDGTFQGAVTYDSGRGDVLAMAVADLNSDGKPDLVLASDGIGVWLGNGDGTFLPMNVYSASGGTHQVFLTDLNGDGKLDLVGINGTSNSADVRLGNGDGTFQELQTSALGGSQWSWAAIADVNGDGRPDLLSANWCAIVCFNEEGNVGVLLNNTGTFNATTTTLASSLNPSIYGQPVAFTAHVTTNSGTPTGTVILLNGSTTVGSGTLANSSASIVVSSLPVRADSITATYQGGAGFASSTSTPLTQTVHLATTSTTLASSTNPAGTSQSVTFTATVASQFGGAATGSVVFFSGSQTLGTASLSGNHASLTTSFSATGTYSISAKYNGDGNNSASTSSTLSQVILATTTTALTSSLNPSIVGQAVTFTATVSSTAGAPPNGELITFKNGSAVLGTAALSGGSAVLTTSSLAAGVYTITAIYGGDANFTASTSPALRQVVNSTTKSATSTTLSSSLNPSIYGQSVTFKATVTTTGSVAPTGTVNFTWSGYSIGTAALNSSGIATLSKSNLNVYTYPLVAAYSGDANNLASTSTILNQVVKQTTSTATLTSSPNPSTQGQAVTFTAKITSPTVVPTGPVTFKIGNTVLGTAQLSAGKATFTTSTLPAGSTIVTVTYPWNSNIAASSASMTQTVQP